MKLTGCLLSFLSLPLSDVARLRAIKIAAVLVTVKHSEYLIKTLRSNAFVQVALLEKLACVLHHLNRCRAQLAGLHGHVCRVQLICGADFLEVQGLGLAAFRNDQDASVTVAARFLLFAPDQLPDFGLVVAPHQCLAPSSWLRKSGKAPYRPCR